MVKYTVTTRDIDLLYFYYGVEEADVWSGCLDVLDHKSETQSGGMLQSQTAKFYIQQNDFMEITK